VQQLIALAGIDVLGSGDKGVFHHLLFGAGSSLLIP